MDASFFTSIDFAIIVAGIVALGAGLIGLSVTEAGVKVSRRLIKSA